MEKTQTFENKHLVPEGLLELNEYLTRPGGIFDEPHLLRFIIGLERSAGAALKPAAARCES